MEKPSESSWLSTHSDVRRNDFLAGRSKTGMFSREPPWKDLRRSCKEVIAPNISQHRYRTFNVANPTNTKMTVMIQKRTITFGSAQPFNSK